jgi:glutathione-regulated potassium-efflux system ancillary protein KefG
MQALAPFALFGSRTAVEENRLHCHVDDWRCLLEALRDDQIDLQQAAQLPMLNGHLDTLIEVTV